MRPRGSSPFSTRAFFWPLRRLCSQTLSEVGFSYPPGGPSLFATALGILRAKRVVARRPVRIGFVRSVCRIHYAIASNAAVITCRTSLINFRFSNHPGVPLWPKCHGLCRRCHRQGQHSDEEPHHSFLLAKLRRNTCAWVRFVSRGCSAFRASGTSLRRLQRG